MQSQHALVAGVLVCFIGGTFLSLQAGINGSLAGAIGSPIAASFFSFAIGTACLALTFPVRKPSPNLCYVREVRNGDHHGDEGDAVLPPGYLWVVGGVLGAIFVTGNTFFAPILGSLHFVCMVTGQLILSLALDNFNFLGVHHAPITWFRLLGATVTIGGSILSIVDRFSLFGDEQAGDDEGVDAGMLGLYIPLAILNGFPVALQPVINNAFTGQLKTLPERTATMSFFVGTVVLGIVWGVAQAVTKQQVTFGVAEAWMFCGGLLGAFYVTVATASVQYIGASLLVTAVTGGQLIMSVVMDQVGLFGFPQTQVTALRVCGVILAMIGAVLMKLGDAIWARYKPCGGQSTTHDVASESSDVELADKSSRVSNSTGGRVEAGSLSE